MLWLRIGIVIYVVFFHRTGRVHIERVNTPVINYAVESSKGCVDTLRERYYQAVRHMWGLIEVPFTFGYYFIMIPQVSLMRLYRIAWKMISCHFITTLQFEVIWATLILLNFHLPSEKSSLLYLILFNIMGATATLLAIISFTTAYTHIKYELFIQHVWKSFITKNNDSDLEESLLLHGYDKLRIPLLDGVTWKQRIKCIFEFILLTIIPLFLYGFLPGVVAYTRMIFSPYFTYHVAVKPKLNNKE